jgi:hypothetical protein
MRTAHALGVKYKKRGASEVRKFWEKAIKVRMNLPIHLSKINYEKARQGFPLRMILLDF